VVVLSRFHYPFFAYCYFIIEVSEKGIKDAQEKTSKKFLKNKGVLPKINFVIIRIRERQRLTGLLLFCRKNKKNEKKTCFF
jgi:hypothetical protein